ncbi:MAG: hypothetical protein GXP31_06150 [Kiritimatiellaeota bacterium]|nr:hypothetical protein [Kiritimatiellota bacterium]
MNPPWRTERPSTPAERFLHSVLEAAERNGRDIWLYGGYALEAHVGHRLREHRDVDFIAEAASWPAIERRVRGPQYEFRYAFPTALHVYGAGLCLADVLLVEEHPDGFPCVRSPLGANPLPRGSLAQGRSFTIWGHRVRLVTPECLFVMKASGNFTATAGAELRDKDRRDLALLRGMLSEVAIQRLASCFRIVSAPTQSGM